MKEEKFTADNFKKISKLIDSTCAHVLLETRTSYLYTNNDIRKRIAQVLAMEITEPILRRLNLSFIQKKEKKLKKIIVENFNINFTTGLIKASSILIFICTLKFLLLWSYTFILFILSFIKKSSINGKVILIHGVPASEISSEIKVSQFERFCLNGPIQILTEHHNLIVQSTRFIERKSNSKFIYTRYPLLKAIRNKSISLADMKIFFLIHCQVFYNFFKLTYNSSLGCLLWRDFALHSFAEFLNKKKLIQSNVITNTNWLNQFLWMTSLPDRIFETHIILYSLNSSPLRFKKYPTLSPHPSIKYLRADYIYIWHRVYLKVLQKEGINIKPVIVPPIVWYLPEIVPTIKSKFIFKVCIFDVTPMSERGLNYRGMIGNYYNFKNMTSFISDIIYVADQISSSQKNLKIEITLKHKRIKHTNFDSEYINFVRDLSLTRNDFKIAHPHSSIFNLIASNDVAISAPFSSPAYIADYLKIPSLFYDPTGDLIYDKYMFPDSIKFASDRKALKIMLENLIKS